MIRVEPLYEINDDCVLHLPVILGDDLPHVFVQVNDLKEWGLNPDDYPALYEGPVFLDEDDIDKKEQLKTEYYNQWDAVVKDAVLTERDGRKLKLLFDEDLYIFTEGKTPKPYKKK